jgi:hypothetical protein
MPDTRPHIRNEGPLKGYSAQAYKPKDPPPKGYKEGTRIQKLLQQQVKNRRRARGAPLRQ